MTESVLRDHQFQREKLATSCRLCMDYWPSVDGTTTKFHSCSFCGIIQISIISLSLLELCVHTSCKPIASKCFPCVNEIEKGNVFNTRNSVGKVHIKLLHAYDINVSSGTILYAKISLNASKSNKSFQTINAITGERDCVWEDFPEQGISQNNQHFDIEVPIDIDDKDIWILYVEIWALYMGIFSKKISKSKFSLIPVLEYPNLLLERWFPLKHVDVSNGDLKEGKLLVSFNYEVVNESDSLLQIDKSDEKSKSENEINILQVNNEVNKFSFYDNNLMDYFNPLPVPSKSSTVNDEGVISGDTRNDNILMNSIWNFGEKAGNVIGNFLYEMEAFDHSNPDEKLKLANNYDQLDENTIDNSHHGVGLLFIHLISVFKYNVKDIADGNHYVLLSLEDNSIMKEFKTNTVFSSATPIFNIKWTVKMTNYRSAVKLFLVDATSHKKLSYVKISVYSMLQKMSDNNISNWNKLPIENYIMKSINDKDDFGYLTAQILFKEDIDGLFLSNNSKLSPEFPEEQLSVERLSIHISRFTAIIELFGSWFEEYLRIMDWSDPIYTGIVFSVFIYCMFKIDSSYLLSALFFIPVVLMTRTLVRRKNGQYKTHYVQKGIKPKPVEYKPVAKVKIAFLGYSDKSSDHSTGVFKPSIKLTYSPMHESNDPNYNNKQSNTTFLPSKESQKEFIVGYINSSSNSIKFSLPDTNRVVSQIVSNIVGESGYKDNILHNVNDVWLLNSKVSTLLESYKTTMHYFHPSDIFDISLIYPIIQPISSKVKNPIEKRQIIHVNKNVSKDYEQNEKSPHEYLSNASKNKSSPVSNASFSPGDEKTVQKEQIDEIFLPWEFNTGYFKLSIRDDNLINFIDNTKEEYAKIFIKDIVQDNSLDDNVSYEIIKWFPVFSSWEELQRKSEDPENAAYVGPLGCNLFADDLNSEMPNNRYILLRIQLNIHNKRRNVSNEEKELSSVLQNIISDSVASENSESTISVIWNMRDNVKYTQNLMCSILDSIESFKNIFNWSSPRKTYPIYFCFILIWFITILIPGRIIILLLGLYQFLYVFLPPPTSNLFAIRFQNLLRSVPNDDDLEQIYSRERKDYLESSSVEIKEIVNRKKFDLVIKTFWKGILQIKFDSVGVHNANFTSSEWIDVYLLLQGTRLIWWESERDLEHGKEAVGQLLLCGHTGVTQASPVDIKQFGGDARLMAVFGRDTLGAQQKMSIYCKNHETKIELYDLIQKISSSKS